VVSDIPPGKLAIGVPARVAGPSHRPVSRARQRELVLTMLDELRELLELRGCEVSSVHEGSARGIEVRAPAAHGLVLFVETLTGDYRPPGMDGETVLLTLELASSATPAGTAVLDLLGRQVHGGGGVLLDSVREFCRKRGIRFEPGPWRYRGGLI
jgi:hypothetical protein